MNILTFDIEDWYNCDFITPDLNWEKYEVRIYQGINRILEELEIRNQKGTFFCLGWIAEKHPDVIRQIYNHGHQIGCHSYQHELVFRLDRERFKQNTEKAKKLLEDIIGQPIHAFRAPGFSITEKTIWAFDVLSELNFEYDSSLFPAKHDYGGFPSLRKSEPVLLKLKNGAMIKEFPINIHEFMGRPMVFSGGGFFRFYPYWLIKNFGEETPYMMTYFHTRDFDPNQPMVESLPLMRKFKSYVGLKHSFGKFRRLLDDFEFVNIEQANAMMDWEKIRTFEL